MSQLADSLTVEQAKRLSSGDLRVEVDLSPIYPGCFVVRDGAGRQGTGRSPRLAVECLDRHLHEPD